MQRRNFLTGLGTLGLSALAPSQLFSKEEVLYERETPWGIPQSTFADIWYQTTGKRVRIAIVDTGVNQHADLPKPVAERDFTHDDNPRDLHGHGTHCAGTALGRNGTGVAPGADVINAKALTIGGGSGVSVRNAVEFALDNRADIVSMSLEGGADPQTMNMIKDAVSAGVIFCVAAGNSGWRPYDNIRFPGEVRPCWTVGATQGPYENQTMASFSSVGMALDVAAPGQKILSCSHEDKYKYVYMSGTSMATPYMAGAAALLREKMRKGGYARPKGLLLDTIIRKSCDDILEEGFDRESGNGIINLSKLLDQYTLTESLYHVQNCTLDITAMRACVCFGDGDKSSD